MTNQDCDEISRLLKIDTHHRVFGTLRRDNIVLSASHAEDKMMSLIELLRQSPFDSCNSIIIYCSRKVIRRLSSEHE